MRRRRDDTAVTGGVLAFLPGGAAGGNFWGFLTMFILMFVTTGIGNGSTFRMIPVIFLTERKREAEGKGAQVTGGPEAALWGFLAFYATCIVVTWWFYSRRNADIPC